MNSGQRSELNTLAAQYLNNRDFEINLLKGDGSDRKIFRIAPAAPCQCSVIGVVHDNLQENRDFLFLTRVFEEAGIPVPTVYKVNASQTAYLLEDLGPCNLAECIQLWKQSSQHDKIVPAYKNVLQYLVQMQLELPHRLGDFLKDKKMGRETYQTDLAYFQNSFLEKFGFASFYSKNIELELRSELVDYLSELKSDCFVYRDFQSRNIMWLDGSPWFIDYQSAFQGPPFYDLASLLFASKSGLDERSREVLLAYFFDISGYCSDFTAFQERFYRFVVLRRLRSLGTYGFLSMEKHKTGFLQSIRPTLLELSGLFSQKYGLKSFRHLPKMIREILKIWEEQGPVFGQRPTEILKS